MKNIHILPTDKPSRLSIRDIDNKLCIHRPEVVYHGINQRGINQNIYITSDEEIKEGDWFILHLEYRIAKRHKQLDLRGITPEWSKKIILTTDQDLINDGVQAIDDEFLEWFVKNPSCEKVEVEDYGNLYNFRYLILIPKEEPKQETTSEGFHRISKEFDYSEFDFVSFKIGTEWQQEQFSKSEFIQLVRATKSDAEARRIIREYFK